MAPEMAQREWALKPAEGAGSGTGAASTAGATTGAGIGATTGAWAVLTVSPMVGAGSP